MERALQRAVSVGRKDAWVSYAEMLIANAVVTVRGSGVERHLVHEVLSRLNKAGQAVAIGRDACPNLLSVIAAIETAEAQELLTREQAAGLLEWLYQTRDVLVC